jgi:UDP:flavonoid glycosyltransferase YjiC (YdhE family)
MTTIVICCTPFQGHVTPLLSVATHFVDNGDRVLFLTGARYREPVERIRATFVALPPEADRDEAFVASLTAANTTRKKPTGLAAVRDAVRAPFVEPIPYQVKALDRILASEQVDVVMAEVMFAGLVGILGLPLSQRPITVYLGVVPLITRSRDTAPFGFGLAPLAGPIGRVRNTVLRLVGSIVFAPIERYARTVVSGAVGANVTARMGEFSTRADILAQFTVRGFEYPRSDLPANVHFLGPATRGATSTIALPSWWDDLDGTRPVIHVTQGTLANSDFTELILPTIEALAADAVLVVVATGGRPVDELGAYGPLPSNVRVAPYLPYDQLLPKVSVLVTNGGYGGVHFALEAGVPLVVAGQTEDKAEVSARVAWAKVGINLRTSRPKVAVIRRAVRRVLSDPSYRNAAAVLRDEIAVSPGVAGLDELIEQVARTKGASRTKAPRRS